MGPFNQPPAVKLFFRIGEVARLADVDPSVIRYWEQEFHLRPRRSKGGQRIYSTKEVNKLLEIKRLLHEKRFTTQGALQELRKRGLEPRADDDPLQEQAHKMRDSLVRIRAEIVACMEELDREFNK